MRQRRLQGSICADINGDGLVGVDDLLAVLAAYGSVDAYADLTGNPEDSALLVLFPISLPVFQALVILAP